MTEQQHRSAGSMPSLLRAATATYTAAVRQALTDDGFDDVPRNGAFALTSLARRSSAAAVQAGLGVSKQAVSALVDTLVLRGYLARHAHPSDRRRSELSLTDRGHGATDAIRRGVGSVDHLLAHRLPDADRRALRDALELLAGLPHDHQPAGADVAVAGTGHGADRDRDTPAPPRRAQLTRAAPVFPVSDPERAAAHYTELGFQVEPYPGGGYGFAQRDGVGIHLHAIADLEPHSNISTVYLYVSDADALAAQWARPHVAGHTQTPIDTDWRMREGSHRDPDGNLIRFGSPLPR